MRPYGAPFAERFGLCDAKTAGYSIVQLIETSSITGHFCELWNSAYLNVFSCREFDTALAASFTGKFFAAGAVHQQVPHR